MLLNPLTLAVESIPGFSRSTDWLERKYTNDASRFVQVGDSRIHYRAEGDPANQTLLLLHGSYSSLQTWDGWTTELVDEFHVVRLDLPGFGLTGPRQEDEHVLSYLVFSAGAFCDQLGLDDVVVAGNSLGGGVAWRLATERPDLVSGAILINAGGGTLLCRIIDSLTAPLFSQFGLSRAVVRLVLTDAYGSRTTPDTSTIQRYHDLILRNGNRRALREISKNFRRDHANGFGPKGLFPTPPSMHDPMPDICDHYELSDVTVPALFQWGVEDTWLPITFGRELATRVPQSTFLAYDDLGHVPMEEAPAVTAADARAFLRSLDDDDQQTTAIPAAN